MKKVRSTCEEIDCESCKKLSAKIRQWITEGRCPQCGELGPIISGGPVCSTHGLYKLLTISQTSTFDGGDCEDDDE